MQSILSRRASLHKQVETFKAEKEELQAKAEITETLANVGLASAMIAHELNNIFMPLINYSELALMHPDDSELAKKALTKAVSSGQRASDILNSLLDLANNNSKVITDRSVQEIINNTFTFLARDFAKDGIDTRIELETGLSVRCEGTSLQQVFVNLISNARDSMLDSGGILSIKGYKQSDMCIVEICDSGEGIEAENLATIFEPFFSTKSKSDKRHNSGNGLGLAFCKKVIDAHDGRISVSSKAGEGTCFRISIPS